MIIRAFLSSLAYVFSHMTSSLGASGFLGVAKKVSRINAVVHDVYMKDTYISHLSPRKCDGHLSNLLGFDSDAWRL